MPTTDLSRNVFSAATSDGARDWASVEGGEAVTFRAGAELRRGLDLDLGLEALAYLDGRFRRYLAAELDAAAHGSLRVRGQIQAPLNLFKESGIAVRLQAAAELAAGASLTLGLSVGDFLDLVRADPAMQGLPYRLFEVFLEEVTVGAGVYAKVALSAMAQASLAITGSLLESPSQPAGFNIVAEAAVGLKAGAGYRVVARAGFDDARRFVGRTTDVLVDETIGQIAERLPAGDPNRVLLEAMRPPAKMALRSAYEIGELVATRMPPVSGAGQAVVAQRCVQIVLEETQRYLLDRLLGAALEEIGLGLELLGISEQDWQAVTEVRTRLGHRLQSMPADPFALTSEAVDYWEGLIDDGAALVDELGGWAEAHRTNVSILWAAAELLFAATRRMLDADDAAAVADLAPAAAHAAFTGAVDSTPPAAVLEHINDVLRREVRTPLRREDLVIFLADDGVFHLLTTFAPEVERYLQIFETVGDRRRFMREALGALGAMSFDESGVLDVTKTLVRFAAPLKGFLQTTISQELAPALRPHLQGRGDLALYFDEVLLPSMGLAVDVVFDGAQRWATGGVDRDAFTEALSSVLMTVVGRSLVVTADVLVTVARGEVHSLFLELADRADGPGGLADVLRQYAPTMDADDVVETVQEVLRIGSVAFGPLPPAKRANFRQLLYDVLAAAVSDDPASYAASLEDPTLMPNPQAMTQLATELGKVAVQNLEDFVREMLRRVADLILDEIKERIDQFERTVEEWVDEVERAILFLRGEGQKLVKEVARLAVEVERRLSDAADEVQSLLNLFSQPSLRSALGSSLADELIRAAETELNKNDVYKHVVPSSVKSVAREALNGAVDAAVDSAVTAPAWTALGALSFDLNQLITDVRGFDRNRGIGAQLRDLIVNRAEDAVNAAFGANPAIDLKFSVSWQVTALGQTATFSAEIDLGRIEVPVNDLLKVLRTFLEPLTALDAIVQPLSAALAAALQAEAQLVTATAQREETRTKTDEAEALMEEAVTSFLDITIAEPAPGALYDADVPLRVDVAGAPLSFLGREAGEQQRILVWLNEQVLDLGGLQSEMVEGWAAPTPGSAQGRRTGGKLQQDQVLPTSRAPARVIAEPSVLENQRGRVVQPSAPPEPAPTPTVASITGASSRFRAVHDHTLALAHASPVASALARGDLVVTRVGDGRSRANGSAETRVPPASVPVGRRPTVTDLQVLGAPPVAALRLTGTLSLSSLVEGINTIVVAVTDGAGRRVEKAASFIAAAPLAEPEGRTDVRLPEVMLDASLRMTVPHVLERPDPRKGAGLLPPRARRAADVRAAVNAIERIRRHVNIGAPGSTVREEPA